MEDPQIERKPSVALLSAMVSPSEGSVMTIEQCIVAWLDAKAKRSESAKTRKAYADGLTDFRAALHAAGYDLDSPSHVVELAAQGWAGTSKKADRVSPATY